MTRRTLALLVALPLLAAVVAWPVVTSRGEAYERTMVFVVRPSPSLDPSQVPDAVRGVGQESSQLVFTVARVIQTEPFRRVLGRALGAQYELEAAVPPATNVIEVRVRGPDPNLLRRFESEFVDRTSLWVEDTYPAYRLDFLEGRTAGPVGQSTLQLVALAALLGLLVALLAVFARSRRGEQAAPSPTEEDESRVGAVEVIRPSAASARRSSRG